MKCFKFTSGPWRPSPGGPGKPCREKEEEGYRQMNGPVEKTP